MTTCYRWLQYCVMKFFVLVDKSVANADGLIFKIVFLFSCGPISTFTSNCA